MYIYIFLSCIRRIYPVSFSVMIINTNNVYTHIGIGIFNVLTRLLEKPTQVDGNRNIYSTLFTIKINIICIRHDARTYARDTLNYVGLGKFLSIYNASKDLNSL